MKNCLKNNVLLFLINILFFSCLHTFTQDVASECFFSQIKAFQGVEHKNLELNLYLDLIQYNTQEKIGILPYILKNPGSIYLEIGTGGDPIAEMLTQIPSTLNITLIASDVEQSVLEALLQRHPKLQKYIDAHEGPKLKLMQLDATDMSVFEDCSLKGINASSVVHEIISYGGGYTAMHTFFQKVSRKLQPGGVLTYRDPEGVWNRQKHVSLTLKNKSIRLFAHIFLCKFLDARGSSLEKAGRKFCDYKPEDIKFIIFKKKAIRSSTLTYEEYLKVPSYDIDFFRTYIIAMPYGLYRELARHYLTYLHQCNPLVYVKCTSDILSGNYVINYLAHSTNKLLSSFLTKNGESLNDEKINFDQKIKLDQHIENLSLVLEFGISVHLSSKRHQCELRNILQTYGLNPYIYIIPINNQDCLLDYRVFGLLYDEINRLIFNEFNGIISAKDEEHAKWLKREGEESYFYLSADELITTVMKITQMQSTDMDDVGTSKTFVLCPISIDHNKFIERLCYSEILKNSLEVYDDLGYEVNVIDGKRVIHFSKMTLQEAIDICSQIVKQDPIKYKKLKEYIDSIKVEVKDINDR